ncbi:hypothetical protein A4A49_59086 [Nicotiana attenuata]|uniref:Replication protein a 70 kDa dna-binding subunit b n=1 Tax=Nicotiana attenuata TaxID=49451 RepID=A0A314KK88_NICAT|nr:hypothetical protein A4A49_59086 [Nicotiana attenuata]
MVCFADIDKQIPGDEFADLVAVVANCGTMKYQGSENRRFQEVILIDDKKKPFLFTIWGELADNDGTELLQQLHRYPVIVAKRIAVSNFKQGIPKLLYITHENKHMLIEYTLKSTSESPSTLNVAPFEDQIVPISTIPSQSTAQSFYVEGEISLPSEFQFFFVLLCSECQHLARIKRKKKVLCINYKLERMLIPR